ncbi:unnamed protein product [marine sediment metagenome]|uniref:Uncharacterized protein n=1 Tax=marine sediment metagenome TaxID=412755 RepID=X1DYS6_9ZZZZ
MKILVLVGVYKGVVEEVKVFRLDKIGAEAALKAKEELMKEYEIKEGLEEFAENDVKLFDREV